MIVKHFQDIRFTVVASVPDEYQVDYRVYEIVGTRADGRPLWQDATASHGPAPIETLEKAELFLHGFVKWDGCSNWHFDAQDSLMLHGCSREDLTRLGEIMAQCWDWTRDLCSKFEG